MTVAVAHSGSAAGRAALHTGVLEARLRGTDLAVLRVSEQPTPGPEEEAGVRAQLAAELEEAAPGLAWQLHLVGGGHDPAGALVDLATELAVELVVLGTRRRSPVGKLLLGSVAQRVLLDCPLPVMVVKPER